MPRSPRGRTYKALPDAPRPPVEIAEVYDAIEARATIDASFRDYVATSGSR